MQEQTDKQGSRAMGDLRGLIEAVEGGTFLMDVRPLNGLEVTAYKAFGGSLDAAKALHEALLPGWKWGRQWSSHMWVEPNDMPGRSDRFYGEEIDASNAARAWLLAVLRALEAEGDK